MMEKTEVSIVLGTAGHIDHGKTTLVRALSGVDCDRLRDEKRRGITIELGFAPLTLPSGKTISIVDVPGHEKFIRQMVAGAAGVDGIILVVASDEGVRPQTREHLEILGLIGVEHGLIVLTKADLVEEEFLELAIEEVKEEVRGTFLEGAEVIPVSSVTGFNLDALLESLERLVAGISPRGSEGPFFMPIDRAFPVKGFGAVVTGTAYRGRVRKDDVLSVLPRGIKTDIRSVQVHDNPVDEARSGQRVALSLGGVSLSDLERGDVLCTPGIFAPSSRLDVDLKILASSPDPLHHWQRVRIHLGTTDTVGRIALLGVDRIEPGERAFAQVVTETPVVAVRGEPFIIRFYSPLTTIGGGKVLMPIARRPKGPRGRKDHQVLLDQVSRAKDPGEFLLAVTLDKPVVTVEEAVTLMQERPGAVVSLAAELDRAGRLLLVDSGEGLIVNGDMARKKLGQALSFLKEYHEEEPDSPGVPSDTLFRRFLPGMELRHAKKVLDRWAREGEIEVEDQRVRLPGFSPGDAARRGAAGAAILDLCSARSLQLPETADILEGTGLGQDEMGKALEALRAQGQIFIAGSGFIVSREVLEGLIGILVSIKDDITVASVRDATGSSRKYILPLLEMLDSMGVTRRVQDKRILKKSRLGQD
ncbi:MAG TPA: selenocysteine-specific translation elongation factor [Thermovirgaceae bacterium]|nr:selenocysteine-specific translation elongation factor [Thermovirgaceae bacterium]HRU91011.1 selenocysteine-specific translation elongation factor [Thermovirgaceae bacterium]